MSASLSSYRVGSLVFEVLFGQYDPYRPSVLHPADATTLGAHVELRLLVHVDLGDQPAGRRIPPGELDSRPPAAKRYHSTWERMILMRLD